MPLSFPSSPTIGQVSSYNGKDWQWMGGYWSASSRFAPVALIQNTFVEPALQNYYETLIASGANPVSIESVSMLQHT